MTDLTPPGPAPHEPTPPARKTGGLPVDEWLEHQATLGEQGRAPYAAPPQPDPLEPPSRKMAGWALGLSLAFCIPFAFLVGFGLAIAVLVRSRDGRDHGKGMAIAALVISAVIVVANVAYVLVYLFGGMDGTERDADGNVVEAGTVTLNRLRVGDCYNGAERLRTDSSETSAPSEVEVLPCATEHDLEVFAALELPEGDYPGDAAVDDQSTRCFDEFTDFNGRRWRQRSGLDFLVFMPTSASWRLGDRTILCSVYEVDGARVQGSLEGARR